MRSNNRTEIVHDTKGNVIPPVKTVTCKLPENLYAELEAAAREEGVSKSQVLRKALEDRIGRNRAKQSPRAFDLVKDLGGSVKC